jgi:uncharacterized Zn finger protein
MEEIFFAVQGSAVDPYQVRFVRRGGGNLMATCTCPAGAVGQYCKHRFNLMAGSAEGLVSPNHEQVPVVRQWLAGTDVEAAMHALAEAETQMADAKRLVARKKKELAAALRD